MSTSIGNQGEQDAVRYLQKNGYTILEQNWRGRYAEIDIVAVEDDALVAVEVKARTSDEYGTPEESITPHKIATLKRAIQYYKIENSKTPDLLRIDFVGIDYREGKLVRLNLIKNITQ
jgi:putative endonuclease